MERLADVLVDATGAFVHRSVYLLRARRVRTLRRMHEIESTVRTRLTDPSPDAPPVDGWWFLGVGGAVVREVVEGEVRRLFLVKTRLPVARALLNVTSMALWMLGAWLALSDEPIERVDRVFSYAALPLPSRLGREMFGDAMEEIVRREEIGEAAWKMYVHAGFVILWAYVEGFKALFSLSAAGR